MGSTWSGRSLMSTITLCVFFRLHLRVVWLQFAWCLVEALRQAARFGTVFAVRRHIGLCLLWNLTIAMLTAIVLLVSITFPCFAFFFPLLRTKLCVFDTLNKSVFSLLRRLETWHWSPLLLTALIAAVRRCCWAPPVQQSIDITCTGPSPVNPPHAAGR